MPSYLYPVSRLIGLVVSLWSPSSNQFLSLLSSGKDSWKAGLLEVNEKNLSPSINYYEKLPTAARFLVVDAGDGQIGLYNQALQKFVIMNDSGALTVGAVEMKFSELLPESADRKSRFEIISFDDDQKIVAFHNRNNNQIIATEGNSVVGKNADEINGKLQIDWKASGFVLIPYLEPGQEIALWSSSSQTFVPMRNKTFHLATLEDKILPHELEFWRDWARFEVVNTSKTNGQISLYNKAHNKFVDVNEGIVAGRENITFYEQTLNVVTLVDGEIALQNSHFDSFLRMQGTVVNASRGELNRHLASYKFVVVANPRVRLPRDYVKFKTLGEGKTASVFEARNALDDGMYAVKYLTGNHATNRFTWQNELHMMGQLPMHPNIVRYFTATVFESRLFIVTELINGISLQAACTEYAAHRKFDEERMLSWAEQIASGLAALHARRILHRYI